MSISFITASVIEILVGAFVVWGLFHEDSLVRFEDRALLFIKRRIRHRSGKRPCAAPQIRRSPAQRCRPASIPAACRPENRNSHCA